MAKPRMDLSAFVDKLFKEQDGEVLREAIELLSQSLMQKDVGGLIGAERQQRTSERTARSHDAGHAYAAGRIAAALGPEFWVLF